MISGIFGVLYQHVFNVDLYHFPYILLKYLVNHLLVSGTYIFESEYHHIITKSTIVSFKKNHLLILQIHVDLVVLELYIKKSHDFLTKHSLIMWWIFKMGKKVFRAYLIQILKINIYFELIRFLWYHHNVC